MYRNATYVAKGINYPDSKRRGTINRNNMDNLTSGLTTENISYITQNKESSLWSTIY